MDDKLIAINNFSRKCNIWCIIAKAPILLNILVNFNPWPCTENYFYHQPNIAPKPRAPFWNLWCVLHLYFETHHPLVSARNGPKLAPIYPFYFLFHVSGFPLARNFLSGLFKIYFNLFGARGFCRYSAGSGLNPKAGKWGFNPVPLSGSSLYADLQSLLEIRSPALLFCFVLIRIFGKNWENWRNFLSYCPDCQNNNPVKYPKIGKYNVDQVCRNF